MWKNKWTNHRKKLFNRKRIKLDEFILSTVFINTVCFIAVVLQIQ